MTESAGAPAADAVKAADTSAPNGTAADAKPANPTATPAATETQPSAADQTKAAENAPAEIAVKVDGLHEDIAASIVADAKAFGWSAEQAQKFAEQVHKRNAEAEAANAAAEKQAIESRDKAWREELIKDAEFGGAKLQATETQVKAAIDRFATPGFKALLESTKYGNNPELIRTFAAIGRAIADDSFRTGQEAGKNTGMRSLYPSMPNP